MARAVAAGVRWGRPVWVAALALVALAGCKKDTQEAPGASSPGASAPATPGQASGAEVPLKAEALSPAIHALGPEGALPTRIVVDFSRAVATPEQVGGPVKEGTRLVVTPA